MTNAVYRGRDDQTVVLEPKTLPPRCCIDPIVSFTDKMDGKTVKISYATARISRVRMLPTCTKYHVR